MEDKYCQCCAMPMKDDVQYGNESDDTKSTDYCSYCYKDGEITFKGTMDEMIEVCVPHVVEAIEDSNVDEVRKMMQELFPTLKHWATK